MLVLDDLTYRLGDRALLDHASAQIPTGARVGLIGRNGVGKTTLFRILSGEILPESGTISFTRNARIGRLSQEAPDGDEALIDVVLAADTERASLLAEAERESDPLRVAEIQTRLADIRAHSAPARAAAILSGLCIAHEDQRRPCHEFSGGWRMRVALAAVLFSEPDLLLLDEPTNYLDLEGTLWLQAHLARYPRTVILISHDRDLLDTAVDWTLHMSGGKLTLYRGDYSTFERRRREKMELDAKLAKQQSKQREHLQAFVERFRAKASKARQAQSRMKMLEKLQPISAMTADEVRPIALPQPAKTLSPPIIVLDGVAVGYEPERPILRRVSLRIDEDDRIALLGANGNGKSTLAKLLTGRLETQAGRITRAAGLSIGYFAQHQLDELDPDGSAYDHIRRRMDGAPESVVRARAGAIGFPGAFADTPASQLSGGEKARLMLGMATMHAPNLVVLDEPTNHLDIDSRAALIEALNDYSGAVILVSHDRFLLEACVDRLWLVDQGSVKTFEGDLDEYRRVVLSARSGRDEEDGAASEGTGRQSRSELRRAAAEKRIERAPLRKRILASEKEMDRLTGEISKLDEQLAAADLFARGPAHAANLGKARAAAKAALERAESEWLEASAAYENDEV